MKADQWQQLQLVPITIYQRINITLPNETLQLLDREAQGDPT